MSKALKLIKQALSKVGLGRKRSDESKGHWTRSNNRAWVAQQEARGHDDNRQHVRFDKARLEFLFDKGLHGNKVWYARSGHGAVVIISERVFEDANGRHSGKPGLFAVQGPTKRDVDSLKRFVRAR